MKLVSRALLVAVVATVALGLSSSAGAAIVTVGPSLNGEWEPEECVSASCTFVNLSLEGAAANVTSPVTGAIVRFSVVGGENSGQYRLRTGHAVGPASFVFSHWTEPVPAVPSHRVQSFPASLPVETGQWLGLTMIGGASMGFRENVGQLFEWETEPPENGLSFVESGGHELAGFNAEVQPAPTIASLGTTSGSTSGGTAVAIIGTDLQNVTGVKFGGTSASFTAESEGRMTAVAPANPTPGPVPVTVTTIAGMATTSPGFDYEAPPVVPVATTPPAHCVVPVLTGKRLKGAREALAKAQCKLGSVKKLGGATSKAGKISKQSSKPESQLAVGSRVGVTLKPAKPVSKNHGKK